jgi:tetratricopeptide (TPR) repeat protein
VEGQALSVSNMDASADASEDPPGRDALSLEQLAMLREPLDAIADLERPDTWRKVLTELRPIQPALDPELFAPDFNTFDILKAAAEAEQGLPDLAMGVRTVLGRKPGCMAFTDLVNNLLSATQRDHLRRALGSVQAEAHAEAVRHPEMAEHADLLATSRDAAEAFDLFGGPGPDRTLDQLRFAEIVGHVTDRDTSILIHTAIEHVISGTPGHRAAVREFCASLRTAAASSTTTAPVTSDHDGGKAQPADGDNKVITLTLQESDGKPASATRSTVWGGIPPRNVNFAGRTAILEQIRASLQKDSSTALVPMAVHGYGGVGKTQIAIEFAYRYQEDYDLVWWVASEDEAAIRRSLVSLARRLDVAGSMDHDDIIGSVLDKLRRGDTTPRWLLIFDNAGAPESIQAYRPGSGPGHVIVTSRSNKWLQPTAAVPVDVFTEDESVAMLAKRWPGLAEHEARRLADRLGNLPLALEQAAAVHNEYGMSLDGYLTALDETPTQLLEAGQPAGYSSSVALTFQIAYRGLTEKNLAAAQLFCICALMSSQPISVAMLIRGRGADLPSPLAEELRTEMTRRNAIRGMGGHALASHDPGRDLLKIHQLVRDLLREELSDEDRERYTRAGHSVLALANPGEPDNPDNWKSLQQISPHVISSGVLRSADAEARTVFLDQIRYLYAIGDYAESRNRGEQAVRVWTEMFGPDDIMTLVANRHLANSLRWLGDYNRVAAINRDTLDRMTRLLGVNHEHTLATANSVGADLRLQGRFQEAYDLDKTNLSLCQETLGEDDQITRRAANNLAVDQRLLGRFQEAHDLDLANIRTISGLYGEDDIRTLSSYSSLARDLYGLGAYNEALSLQMNKLRIHENSLPPGHMEILRSRRNEAIFYRKSGHYGQAVEAARSTLERYRTSFGETHDQTFAATLTLANTLRVTSELEEAQRLGVSALESYRINLGADHPITYATMVDVAIIHRLANRVDEALAMNTAALDGLTHTLGEKHQWRLCALANQANLFSVRQDHEAALKLSQEAVSLSELVRGPKHPYTLACIANLSLDLEAAGQLIEANARRRSATTQLRELFGTQHPEVINVGLEIRTDADIEPPSI